MKVFVHATAFPYAECLDCGPVGANGMVHVPALQCPLEVVDTLGVFTDEEAEVFRLQLKALRLEHSFAQQAFDRRAKAIHTRMKARDLAEEEPA